jgi:NAD(P)-dependent dehydrogenase (short-subunit alcohol dehydrogenase family)
MLLENKVAIVSRAASGIGKDIAVEFAKTVRGNAHNSTSLNVDEF